MDYLGFWNIDNLLIYMMITQYILIEYNNLLKAADVLARATASSAYNKSNKSINPFEFIPSKLAERVSKSDKKG